MAGSQHGVRLGSRNWSTPPIVPVAGPPSEYLLRNHPRVPRFGDLPPPGDADRPGLAGENRPRNRGSRRGLNREAGRCARWSSKASPATSSRGNFPSRARSRPDSDPGFNLRVCRTDLYIVDGELSEPKAAGSRPPDRRHGRGRGRSRGPLRDR